MNSNLSSRGRRRRPWRSQTSEIATLPSVARNDIFIVILFLSFLTISPLCAQGFLPPKESSSTATTAAQGPVLIGEKVPESLMVIDENGKPRHLLSYKSAVEVMVVGAFSASCPEKDSQGPEISRFYEAYKGWGVSFVAMNAGPPGSRAELAKRLDKEGLHFFLVDVEGRSLLSRLKVEYTPEFLIIDESGDLHYRGPIGKDARRAIEAVIGHMDPVPNPEPPETGGCSLK